jgi:hypothetical protein
MFLHLNAGLAFCRAQLIINRKQCFTIFMIQSLVTVARKYCINFILRCFRWAQILENLVSQIIVASAMMKRTNFIYSFAALGLKDYGFGSMILSFDITIT